MDANGGLHRPDNLTSTPLSHDPVQPDVFPVRRSSAYLALKTRPQLLGGSRLPTDESMKGEIVEQRRELIRVL